MKKIPSEMGILKQKWTKEEEAALKAGVDKHGPGKWKTILTDPNFSRALSNRSNIDLKDKWRNLGIAKTPLASKDNDPVLAITCGSQATTQNTNTALSLVAATGVTNTASSRTTHDGGISITRSMVFEAISSIKDSKGSDFNAIASFIEQRHEVTGNFRRYLSSMVRRLTLQGRLEKVEQRYKIKSSGASTNNSTPRVRDVNQGTRINPDVSILDTPDGASRCAAFWVAEADNDSYLAAEAIEEAERVVTMLEESEIILEASKELGKKYNL